MKFVLRQHAVWQIYVSAKRHLFKMLSENGKVTELNRTVISRLIDKIYVYEDKRIEVRFSFEDKYRSLVNLSGNNIKEAV